MSDFRAFGSPPSKEAAHITLSRDESHHLVSVNRARVGDRVITFDGRGHEWDCIVDQANKHAAYLRVEKVHTPVTLPFRITLAQALPKGASMDDIVRHSTEIGAEAIVPLITERTQVHLDGDRGEKKREKWAVTALEAAKQCGNPWVPVVHTVTPLKDLLRTAQDYPLRIVASLFPEAQPVLPIFSQFVEKHGLPERALCAVGPEGDFSPTEMAELREAGFIPVTLGPLVLRCDTAATYLLSVLSNAWSTQRR